MSIEEFAATLWRWVSDLDTCEGCPMAALDREDCARGNCPLEAARDALGVAA